MPPHQKKPKLNLDDLTIGDRVLVNLHHGRKEEALIKAIIPTTGGKKFQVDFGHDQTGLVEEWQIMEKVSPGLARPTVAPKMIVSDAIRFQKQFSRNMHARSMPSRDGLS